MLAHSLGPPVPYPPTNRFWMPLRVFGHCVFLLHPLSEEPVDAPPFRSLCPDDRLCEEVIQFWDHTEFNIGMLCGRVSSSTVLEVSTNAAQDWLDEQVLPETPSIWTRRARYYLFNYVPAELGQVPACQDHGLKLLSDGDWIIYPGSLYEDGRPVYWENSPDIVEVADLPPLFIAAPSDQLLN